MLPDPYPIEAMAPARWRRVDATVTPPGSKSVTNRAVLLAALARGVSVLRGALVGADDARRMVEAVRALGATVEQGAGDEIRVTGVDGRWRVGAEGVRLDLGNAGTATRFLSAAALLGDGPVTIDGDVRMRERPIGELGEALERLGARVEWLGKAECPPLRITAGAFLAAGTGEGVTPGGPIGTAALEFGRTQSSQFISALLLIGPWLPTGITLRLGGEVTSGSYVRMTLTLLDRLGATVQATGDLSVVRVGPGPGRSAGVGVSRLGGSPRGLAGFELRVEPDASGATYFWTAGALLPGARVGVRGLSDAGLQGDAAYPHLLARMGASVMVSTGEGQRGVGVGGVGSGPGEASIAVRGGERLAPILADMRDMPDAVMSLAVACCFAKGHSVIRGVRTLRVKESDRVAALRAELGKIGVVVREHPGDDDAITITPPEGGVDCRPEAARVEFETYRDHRMAMSLALVGLRRPNVWIRDPGCVGKTYPGFWDDLRSMYPA